MLGRRAYARQYKLVKINLRLVGQYGYRSKEIYPRNWEFRKITGFKNAYRIKLADYRIGFFFEKGIIEFARIMHRKEIYKFFP